MDEETAPLVGSRTTTGFEVLIGIDQRALDAIPSAVYVCSADGVIVRYNRRAAELWGHEPTLGDTELRFCGAHRLYRLDGTPLPHAETPMAMALATGQAQPDYKFGIERPDGLRIVVNASIELLTDAAGGVEGAIICFHEVDEPRQDNRDRYRLAAIVDSSEDAIVSKDLDGVVISWNRSAERMFGYTAGEAVGRQVVDLIIPPDRRQEEDEILSRLRRGERIDHYETVRRRKDGSELEISLTVSPVADESGRIVGASKIARDISERKRAERQRELLLAELNHRVKNTLTVVQGIAYQTFKDTGTDPTVLKAFEGRLGALARAHAVLTESSWESASLDELVSGALDVAGADALQVAVEGPPVLLEPRQALAVAIALHELCTNALKYGALSVEGGRVAISWQGSGQAAPRVRLTWQESRGPAVAPPARRGFGTRMIEGALAYELGGTASLEFRSEGLFCVIEAPLGEGESA